MIPRIKQRFSWQGWLVCYGVLCLLGFVIAFLELRTGYHIRGRPFNIERLHDPLTWGEAWSRLPGEFVPYLLFVSVLLLAVIGWQWFRGAVREEFPASR